MNGKQSSRWAAAALLVLVLSAVAVVGCGGDDSTSSSSGSGDTTGSETSSSGNGGGGTIADFEPIRNALDYCKNKTMTAVLKDAGFAVDTYYSEFDPAVTTQNVEDALTKGIDGAVYGGQTPALDQQVLTKLDAAAVPTVLNLAQPPEGTEPAVTLNLAYEEAGLQAVETMLELQPDVKQVAVIAGIEGTEASDEMQKSLEDALAANGLEAEVVEHGDFTSQSGAQITQDLLQAHPDVEVVMIMGDDMALGGLRIAEAQGNAEIIDVNGFSKDALKALEEGRLMAMVYAPVDEWGTMIGEAMVQTMEGESPPKSMDLTTQAINKDTVAQIETSC